MKRIFLAIPMNDHNRRLFEEMKKQNTTTDSLRWTRVENYHVTVYFIGNVDDNVVEPVCASLGETLAQMPSFTLRPATVLPFPSSKPRMIWARFLPDPGFKNTYETCRDKLLQIGVQGDAHHDPIPHCTLARMKHRIDETVLRLPAQDLRAIEVSHCELWESITTSEGVLYRSIETFRLRS